VIARFEFSEVQKRHVLGLIEDWERELDAAPADDLDPPGTA
jgi:hypothetical protein